MDRKYWYWINNLEGIGNVKIRTLLSLGTPEELYNMERKEFECLPVLTGKDIDRIVSKDIRQNIFENIKRIWRIMSVLFSRTRKITPAD